MVKSIAFQAEVMGSNPIARTFMNKKKKKVKKKSIKSEMK